MVRRLLSTALALLGLLSGAHAIASPRPQVASALSIRGGAGPIDAETAAKGISALLLAQGTYATLAPGPNLDAYGISKFTDQNKIMMKRMAMAMLSVGIIGYCCVLKDHGFETAMLWISLMWGAEMFQSVVNMPEATYRNSDIMNLVICSATSFAIHQDLDWAGSAIKFIGAFTAISGLSCMLPSAGDIWNIKTDNADKFLLHFVGASLAALGVAQCTLAWGKGSAAEAIGAYALVLLLSILKGMLVTKEYDLVPEINMNMQYFWAVVMAVVAGSTLLK